VKTHTHIVTDYAHLRKFGNTAYLPIPKAIRALLNWRVGDALLIRAKGNRVLVQSISQHLIESTFKNEPEYAAHK
jgi:bifunctional DNA-binding transcriptional regulator/antitoxin component of YhaV-PrlF toxin-antitoxin module